MASNPVRHTVLTPDGAQWRVGRRWLPRRRWRTPLLGRETARDGGWQWLDAMPGDVDLQSGLLFVAIGIVVVLVLIPILLFGLELIIAGTVIAVSLIGRLFLGRPWLIEATTDPGFGSRRILEWRVSGWRRSRHVIEEVCADISAGREPDPASAQPVQPLGVPGRV